MLGGTSCQRKLQEEGGLLSLFSREEGMFGEQLARMEMFLFFTSLLHKFTFSAPPGVEPSLEAQGGVTLSPKPFHICISNH
ncbi:hypothetical protein AAFF_G00239570 [Aldrovandia affinis]|uniref:Uncharacterized protein n=1 Tax=Aldrovandia affinis TaxID=143900 RepID=A0AAD7REA2_9TELE|nr:hypothetical protein AAFF_G00239570 [Aldrovandia affinis]